MHKKKKYVALLFPLLLLAAVGHGQTWNPAIHVTVNDAMGQSGPAPLEGRSMFWDGTNFLYRAYQSTSEVVSYLNTTASRTGNFIIIVDSGGTLQGNGIYLTPHNTYYMFADSTTNGGLVKLNIMGNGAGSCSTCLLSANNLSDLQSLSTALVNLNLNNVDNTSDATKNAATATLTNKSISGTTNTFSNIPNAALSNSAIGLTLNNSGTTPQVTTTPATLGNSIVLSVPYATGSNSGFLHGADWTFFDGKLDSVHISNDSVYNCVNGTCTLQTVIGGGGAGISSLNGLTTSTQIFATGTTGSDFNIVSSVATHTFNFPNSSGSNRGLLTATDWTAFNGKQDPIAPSNTVDQYWNGFENFVALNSDSITEGTNHLFFTNARARAAISLTTTGSSGAATYNNSTGVLNIPNYSGGGGSATITGTSGGSQSSPFTFAVDGTSTTATGLTIPGSSSTFTFSYPKAWDFFDNSRYANYNLFGGPNVGNTTLSGTLNTIIGTLAAQQLTTGTYNVGIGDQVLGHDTSGSQNTALGWVTLFSNLSGNFNTAVGSGSMSGDSTGSNNTALGQIALDLAAHPNYCTALGTQALGAEGGSPYYTVDIGAFTRSTPSTVTDSFTVHIGGQNQKLNGNATKDDIGIGYNQENTFSAYHFKDIIIGDVTSAAYNKGTLTNVTAIGHSLLQRYDSVATFGTKSQIVMLADSGGTTATMNTLQHIGGGIWYVRDSATGFNSGYVVWQPAGNKWISLGSSFGSGGGFANPMTTAGDIIVGGAAGAAGRLGIGANTYVLTSNGTAASWQPAGGGSVAWNNITNATAIATTNNAGFKISPYWTSLAGDSAFALNINTTAAAAGQVGFSTLMQGINSTSGVSTVAATIENAHTGTTSTNTALVVLSQGATTNYGIVCPSLAALNGLGTLTPSTQWEVTSAGLTTTDVKSTGSGEPVVTEWLTHNSTGDLLLYALPSTYSGTYDAALAPAASVFDAQGSAGANIEAQSTNGSIRFFAGGQTVAFQRAKIDSIGRFHLAQVTGPSLFDINSTRADNNPGLHGATVDIGSGTFTDNNTTASSSIWGGTMMNIGSSTWSNFHTAVTDSALYSLKIGSLHTGVNTTALDSGALWALGRIRADSGLILRNLFSPATSASYILVKMADSSVAEVGIGSGLSITGHNLTASGGSTPTFQQVLTAGTTLTGANSVTNTGQPFTWTNGGTGLWKWSGNSQDTTNTAGVGVVANDSSQRMIPWAKFAVKLADYLPTYNINLANGLTGAGSDSGYLGGPLNQTTTIATSGFSLLITGLPDKTPVATDSALIEDNTGKLFKAPGGYAGTWTPTVTAGTNVSAGSGNSCTFSRTGNVVTFAGTVNATITLAATASSVDISLPVASTFTAITDGNGTVGSNAGLGANPLNLFANTGTGNTLTINFGSGASTGGYILFFSGQYIVH